MPLPMQIGDVRQPADKSKHNKFCGPAALSILTGIDTQQAAALIRRHTGKRSVHGTVDSSMWNTLHMLGYRTEVISVLKTKSMVRVPFPKPGRPAMVAVWKGPTLNQWWSSTKEMRGGDAFLVSVGHHWVIVQGSRRCCGIIKEVVFFDDEPGRAFLRKHVDTTYRITKVTEVDVARLMPTRVQAQRMTAEVRARRTAKRLAEEFDVDLDYISDPKMPSCVYPPGELSDDENWMDPHEGDHTVSDWFDVLGLVEEYVGLVRAKRIADEHARGLQLAREAAAGEFKKQLA